MPARKYDLEERTTDFAVLILDILECLPDTRIGNHIAGQMLRSGTSPAANYSESQSAESKKDFIHKLKLSLKELRETRTWLKIIVKKRLAKEKADVRIVLDEC